MEEVSFEDLIDDMITGKVGSALLAHNPDEVPEKDTLINMIVHFGGEDYEAYEKCARLVKKLHKFYPEEQGKLIEI